MLELTYWLVNLTRVSWRERKPLKPEPSGVWANFFPETDLNRGVVKLAAAA